MRPSGRCARPGAYGHRGGPGAGCVRPPGGTRPTMCGSRAVAAPPWPDGTWPGAVPGEPGRARPGPAGRRGGSGRVLAGGPRVGHGDTLRRRTPPVRAPPYRARGHPHAPTRTARPPPYPQRPYPRPYSRPGRRAALRRARRPRGRGGRGMRQRGRLARAEGAEPRPGARGGQYGGRGRLRHLGRARRALGLPAGRRRRPLALALGFGRRLGQAGRRGRQPVGLRQRRMGDHASPPPDGGATTPGPTAQNSPTGEPASTGPASDPPSGPPPSGDPPTQPATPDPGNGSQSAGTGAGDTA